MLCRLLFSIVFMLTLVYTTEQCCGWRRGYWGGGFGPWGGGGFGPWGGGGFGPWSGGGFGPWGGGFGFGGPWGYARFGLFGK